MEEQLLEEGVRERIGSKDGRKVLEEDQGKERKNSVQSLGIIASLRPSCTVLKSCVAFGRYTFKFLLTYCYELNEGHRSYTQPVMSPKMMTIFTF